MNSADNSLNTLQPLGEELSVIIDNKEVKLCIQEFYWGDINRIVNIIASVGLQFSNVDKANIVPAIVSMLSQLPQINVIMQIAIKSELVKYGIYGGTEEETYNKQIDWIVSLRGLDGIKLLTKIVKVNVDFFYQSKTIVETEIPQLKTLTNTDSQESDSEKKDITSTTTETSQDQVS